MKKILAKIKKYADGGVHGIPGPDISQEALEQNQRDAEFLAKQREQEALREAPVVAPSDQERYRDLISKYEAIQKAPQQETDWGAALPDILAGAHNIINYGQGSPQKNIKLGSIDAAKSSAAAKKKAELEGIQQLQGMLQKNIAMNKKKEMSPYEKAQIEQKEKDRAAKEKADEVKTIKEKTKELAKLESVKREDETKNERILQKENRKNREAAEKSLKDIDKQIDMVKKGQKMLKESTKSMISDTGPIDQYISPMSTQGQKLRQTFNEISLDKMTKMFAGMSKAIDSDAERKFFEQSQPSMGNYPEVNASVLADTLKNLESLKQKNKDVLRSIDPKGRKVENVQKVRVQTPDGRTGNIPGDKIEDFMKKHPTAKILE